MKESAKEVSEKVKVKMTPEELKRIEVGVRRAEKLADLLDDKYLDPIIGLFFPEGGDAATALAGLYILYEAKMSPWELAKMVGRTSFDFLHGSIPIIGDVLDFVYKSNKANAEALRKHFEEISAGADMTDELERDLVEKDRSRERKDLKGLKGQVERRKRAA